MRACVCVCACVRVCVQACVCVCVCVVCVCVCVKGVGGGGYGGFRPSEQSRGLLLLPQHSDDEQKCGVLVRLFNPFSVNSSIC